jgi:membrane protein implicated in regulation of membrane protease activity
MSMDTMEIIYLICFFLGLGFAVISGLLSGVFSGGAEAHVDVGGGHGAMDPTGAPDGTLHFTPLSPVTIAMFISSFGGTGIICYKLFELKSPLVHIPISAASGFVVAGIVFYIFYKVFSVTAGSSEARVAEVVGQDAEVTVPIPANGLGEIAYIVRESRYTNPARSIDGKEIPAHAQVKIVKLVGNTYVVQKSQ